MVVRPTIHAPVGPHVLTWRHYLAMWISLGWGANYLGALALVGSLALLGRWRAAALALAPWLALARWPAVDPARPAWGAALGAWLNRRAREYFHLTVVLEDEASLAKAVGRDAPRRADTDRAPSRCLSRADEA